MAPKARIGRKSFWPSIVPEGASLGFNATDNSLPSSARTSRRGALLRRRSLVVFWQRLVVGLILCLGAAPGIAIPFQRVVWHETFESPNVSFHWEITQGLWAFGKPAIGPTNAFSGGVCAATGLQRGSPFTGASSLVSPAVTLPPASDAPRLRFWHWFKIHTLHYGEVSVRFDDGQQEPISPRYNGQAPGWSPVSLDVTKYAGRRVRFVFHFSNYADRDWPGWFIDEVELVAGGYHYDGFEDFEGAWGDWSADRGNWAIGRPGVGPTAAVSGINCAAVALTADRFPVFPIASSLVSPPVTLPHASQEPRLSFQHWFKIHSLHHGQVFILLEDGTEEAISPRFNGQSPSWTPTTLDLSKYAEKRVRFKFHFAAYVDGDWPGWFIDDVRLQMTPALDVQAVPEDFERGWNDWFADQGNWHIGAPTIGPNAAFGGTNCAAVALHGHTFPTYPISSSLVSPRFKIPEAALNPRLTFQHWFKIHSLHHGQVWIVPPTGPEEALSLRYTGDSSGWTTALLQLSKYAGQVVRFKFYFTAYVDGSWPGWFIDDVRVLPALRNTRPQFDPVKPQLAHALEILWRSSSSRSRPRTRIQGRVWPIRCLKIPRQHRLASITHQANSPGRQRSRRVLAPDITSPSA